MEPQLRGFPIAENDFTTEDTEDTETSSVFYVPLW